MDIAIVLDPQSSESLRSQLIQAIQAAIFASQLPPGQKLPSSRNLAQQLGISRSTVTSVYDELLAEGYLESRHGSGTYVSEQLPDNLLQTAPMAKPSVVSDQPVQWSPYGQRILTQNLSVLDAQAHNQAAYGFRLSRPDLAEFPLDQWLKLFRQAAQTEPQWLDYSLTPQGYPPLCIAIAQYLNRSRALNCQPEQVFIVNGTQQATDLISRIFLEPGDAIAVEDPGYLTAQRILNAHGCQLIPIPVDKKGLQVNQLNQHPQIKLVYTTPSHQFPTGVVLSLSRRRELLAWASRTQAIIFEDDYDREYRYRERPLPALQGLSQSSQVIYAGSFSKVLFPALRLGYVVVPPNWVSLMTQARWLNDRHSAVLDQIVLARFIEEGHFEKHLRRMRLVYEQRRQTLVESLIDQFGDQVAILGDDAGIHMMIQLPIAVKYEATILQRTQSLGLGIISASGCYLDRSHQSGGVELLLGYGEMSKDKIVEGVKLLAQVCRLYL